MNLVTGATALFEDAVEMGYIHDCWVWQFLSPLAAQAGRALMDVPVDHEGERPHSESQPGPCSLFSCIQGPDGSLCKVLWDLVICDMEPCRKHGHMHNNHVFSLSGL